MKPRLLLDAATRGDHDAVNKLLLQQGVNVDEVDENGDTPLHHAIMKNHDIVIAALIKGGANLTKENQKGYSPLHKTMEYGNKKTLEVVITKNIDPLKKDSAGDILLHYAAFYGNLEAIKVLQRKIMMKTPEQLQNNKGNTPLHDAVLNSDEEVRNGQEKVIEVLINDFGCDPNTMNNDKQTPLHLAAKWHAKGSIQELIKCWAKLDVQDKENNTPLHIAATYGNLPAIEALIEAKAELNLRNKEGCTPLHECVGDGFVACVEELSKHGAALDVQDNEGDTPLHHAAYYDEPEAAKVLIKAGAKIDGKNKDNKTPLDMAIAEQYPWVAEILFDKLYENNIKDPVYVAMKKIYDDARPLSAEGSDEDSKALKKSLLAANRVVQVMLDDTSTPKNKTDALQALNKNALTLAQGKPSTWKKFIGALTALIGVVALIAGIVLTGGASLVAMCVVGSLFAAGGVGFFAHGMQSSISKDLSRLHQVALKI